MPTVAGLSELVNFCPDLIGRERLVAGGGDARLKLRAPTVFDPPITLAVPALLCREISSDPYIQRRQDFP